MAQLTGLSVLILMCKLRHFLNKFNVTSGVTLLIFLVVLITTILAQTIGYLDIQLTFHMIPNESSVNYLNLKLSLASVLICLALIRYFYIQDQWNRQVEKLSEARLNALQARIKPHFLFNSLNSIASLISIDADRAETAILEFSGLMRQAFSHKEQDITLEDELNWVKDYLSIEKLRLAERLNYQINCESKLVNNKIPVLCLQPLVENAVIHGIQPIEKGGYVDITIIKSESKLLITVTNPFQITTGNNTSNGMALKNIKERLQLQYGSNAYMHIDQMNNTFVVKLGIPL
jgi:two-component system sensor histidine kinase AlgZ